MSYTVDIKGLKELQSKLDKMPVTLKQEIAGVIENGAKTFVRNAQRDAPVDFGFLRWGISYAQSIGKDHTEFTIVSNADYSAYMEWGTITRVKVPAELTAYAMQFKGKGIRRNGGVYPHPFFFKQIPVVKAQIETGINTILKEEKL